MGNSQASTSSGMGQSSFPKLSRPVNAPDGSSVMKPSLKIPEGVTLSDDLKGRLKLSPTAHKTKTAQSLQVGEMPSSQTPTSQVQISPKVNISADLISRVKTAASPRNATSPNLYPQCSDEQICEATAHPVRIIGTSPLTSRPEVSSAKSHVAFTEKVNEAYIDSLGLEDQVRSRVETV
uniref:Uncharacterized protein n=1 Tax=Spongospora subterranea TaxID=70186 RepID=A0A0H5R597_9EUKA|eukprot:CRZ09335.1 hypothetical protein [Spongospora subterranea]